MFCSYKPLKVPPNLQLFVLVNILHLCFMVSCDVSIWSNLLFICFILLAVKGLQILATLPEDIFPISKITYEKILTTFVSVILRNPNQRMLWKVALKALVQIGSNAYRYDESQKALSYMEIIVEKTVSSVLLDDFSLPLPLKMEALSEIGTSGQNHMLRIIQGLEEAIFATLSDVYVCVPKDLFGIGMFFYFYFMSIDNLLMIFTSLSHPLTCIIY